MLSIDSRTTRLTSSGFTETQAAAIDLTIRTSADEVAEALEAQFARWHAYLACYLLAQIGVVLLALLIVQATQSPVRHLTRSSSDVSGWKFHDAVASIHGESPLNRGWSAYPLPGQCSHKLDEKCGATHCQRCNLRPLTRQTAKDPKACDSPTAFGSA